jgi:hypothetical protein
MTALDRGTLAGPTLGPVDLVAVDRVRHGYHAELSDAEERYLYSTLAFDRAGLEQVAKALGVSANVVQQRIVRARAAPPP